MTISLTGSRRRRKTLKPKRFQSSGFTLIELLFVIFMVAMVARFAIPKFNEMTTINLRSAARQMSGLITYTFNRAVLTKKQYRLAIDIGRGDYWVEVAQEPIAKKSGDGDNELAETEELAATDKEKQQVLTQFEKISTTLSRPTRLPRGVKVAKYFDGKKQTAFADGMAYIYFYPIGENTGGYLILTSTEDTSVTLQINPITGRVVNYTGAVEVFNES